MLEGDQLKTLHEVADVFDFDRTPQLAQAIEQGRIGKELWTPIAIAALALAACETMLAHWFSRPK